MMLIHIWVFGENFPAILAHVPITVSLQLYLPMKLISELLQQLPRFIGVWAFGEFLTFFGITYSPSYSQKQAGKKKEASTNLQSIPNFVEKALLL